MVSTPSLVPSVYRDVQEVFTRTLVSDQASPKTHTPYSSKDLATFYDKGLARYADNGGTEIEDYLVGDPEYVDLYLRQVSEIVQGRRFAISDVGYMVLVPGCADIGDYICILPGCNVPYVLREEGDAHLLVGDAYVHGIMYGEVMEKTGVEVVDITLN